MSVFIYLFRVVLARGELDKLEEPKYAARRAELRREAGEATRARGWQAGVAERAGHRKKNLGTFQVLPYLEVLEVDTQEWESNPRAATQPHAVAARAETIEGAQVCASPAARVSLRAGGKSGRWLVGRVGSHLKPKRSCVQHGTRDRVSRFIFTNKRYHPPQRIAVRGLQAS